MWYLGADRRDDDDTWNGYPWVRGRYPPKSRPCVRKTGLRNARGILMEGEKVLGTILTLSIRIVLEYNIYRRRSNAYLGSPDLEFLVSS